MHKKPQFDSSNSKYIFEQLEERQLLSGGIEGIIVAETASSNATYMYAETETPTTAIEENFSQVSNLETQIQEIVFVDSAVEDYQLLLDDLLNNSDRKIEVVLLDSNRNGIEQISEVLGNYQNLDAIHIISHGDDGTINLGNTSLNQNTVNENQFSIVSWADSFSENGDILIYGCNLAETSLGKGLITSLSELTLTDVAASDDLTGHESLGGDWQLEFTTGMVETSVALSAEFQNEYMGTFLVTSFQQGVDGYTGTQDTFVDESIPTDDNGNDIRVEVDLDSGSNDTANGLIRFDDLFGSGPGQIPFGSTIISASLTVNVTNPSSSGAQITMHQMLMDWNESSNWNTTGSGVQNDNTEATLAAASLLGSPDLTGAQTFTGLEDSLQAWSDGTANYGWVILTNNTNGWDFDSSEAVVVGDRPQLTISYTLPNAAPTTSNNTVTADEDVSYVFVAADFQFADADSGDTLQQVQITSLEAVGNLKLSGVDVTLGQVITRASIDAGDLTFEALPGESGSGYDSFEFRVHDGTTYSVATSTISLLTSSFDADADGFSYADITNGSFASGSYDAAGGETGGGIKIDLGGAVTSGPTSGGFSKTFVLTETTEITISTDYRLIISSEYEANEYGELFLKVNGVAYGNDTNTSLIHTIGDGNGGANGDSGWLTYETTITLAAGTHTLELSALNNDSTEVAEFVEGYFDNVSVSSGVFNTMTVDVDAVNDAPTITSNGGGATAAINVVENTTAVTLVTATDIELDTLTFSISGGADQGLFSIDPTSGVLVFDTAPDFDSPTDANLDNVYEVTVETNDGNGGTDNQTISVTITPTEARALWLSTDGDVVSPSGAPGLDAWTDGEALRFSGPGMTFEPSGTSGSFSTIFNIDNFASGATAISALHFVGSDITVGTGTNTFDLQAGDVLATVANNVTLTSSNTQDVQSRDVFVFRPDNPGDYSSGTFTLLLDDPSGGNLSAVTLVEQDTLVGDTTLQAGTFLLGQSGNKDIHFYTATDVGEGSTSGTLVRLIKAGDINIDANIAGLELIEETTQFGDVTLTVGQILVTLDADDAAVGNNNIAANEQDIFVLDVTQTTFGAGTAVANATLLFDGSAVGLDTNNEDLNAIALDHNLAPVLDLDDDDSSGQTASDYLADFVQGSGPVAIADTDASLTDMNVQDLLSSLTVTITNLQDGVNEILAADTSGTSIAAVYSGGVLTLSGSDTVANYQQVLRTITYDNSAGTPALTTRNIIFVANDGVADSNSATTSVKINAPVLDLDANDSSGTTGSDFSATFTVGSSPVGIADTDAMLSDVDSATIDSLAVTITNLQDGVLESLAADTSGTSITGTYNSSTGVLSLTGTDTVANYQQVLRTVSYNNTTADPTTTPRVITFVTNDGTNDSNTATTTVEIVYQGSALWLSTDSDVVSPSGAPGLDAWTDAEVLQFSGVGMTFEPSGTSGSFSSIFNIDNFASGATAISALHFVGSDITVGTGANTFDLQAGDVLATVANNVTLTSSNTQDVQSRDVFVFRPDNPGDYSSGTFTLLLDDPSGGNLSAVSLVEQDTLVGDTTLQAGTFLLGQSGNKDIHFYTATGVGEGSTSGTLSRLIKAGDINIDANIAGLELIEETIKLGDVTLTAGQILVTLDADDAAVGSNNIAANEQDIIVLDVTLTTLGAGTAVANATLLFDGSDVGLDTVNEDLNAIALVSEMAPIAADDWYHVFPDMPLTVITAEGVMANDGDPNSDSITSTLVTGPINGGLVFNSDGSFTYTPNIGFEGVDSFTYSVNDGTFDSATATVTLHVSPLAIGQSLFVSTSDDVTSPSGAPGLDSWMAGEVLEFTDPNLTAEPGTSNGTFSSLFNLDNFAADSDAIVNAMDYVRSNITVGSTNSINLQDGDLLLVSKNDETLTSSNSLIVSKEDVFIFRPDVAGDYSSGTFIMLLENLAGAEIRAISLVEEDTVVGDTLVSAGDFLFATSGGGVDKQVRIFSASDVGAGTTAGTDMVLIDVGAKIFGVELLERGTNIGGAALYSGTLLLTLSEDTIVGDNNLSVMRQDIFSLNVTQTTLITGTTIADATLLFEGADIGLDNNNEDLNALSLIGSHRPIIDLDANNSSSATTDNFNTTFTEDAGPVVIADVDATLSADDSSTLDTLTITINNVQNGAFEVLAADTSGTSITASYVGGTLTLSGTDTLANYQQVLRTVTYDNTDAIVNATTRIISFIANDGVSDSNTAVTSLTMATDQSPVRVNNTGPTLAEGATSAVSSAQLQYTDPQQSAGEVVHTITGALTNGQMELTTNPGVAITSFTQADVDANLLVYVHDGSNTTSDSYTFDVDDGQGNVLADQVFSFTITSVDDDAPTLATNTGSTVAEGGTDPIRITELRYADSEQPSSSVTYTLTTSPSAGQLELVSAPGVAITSFTQAQINNGNIVYVHNGSETTTDSFNFDVDDGQGNVLSGEQFTITVTPVNDASVITAIEVGDLAYNENDGAVAITSTVTVSDSDDTNLESAVVQITGNYVDGEDILSFTTQNGITGVFNSVSGAMTLTGTATVAEYQAAIRSITYTNSSDDPTTATRTVSYTVNDGDVDSNTQTRDITLAASNDAAVIAAIEVGDLAYAENDGAVGITSSVTVSDSDDTNLESAVVQITGNYVDGEDILSFTTQNGITGVFNSVSGAMTLTGTATVAEYQAAIRSITYTNSSDDPTTATRTVSYTVNDGDVDSNTQTRDITLAASNDASVITAIEVGDLAYAENDGAVAITSSVTVSDSDDTNLESAVVQITGNYVDGEDILSFTTQNGITGVFNSVSGAMTLTGTATVAEYQAAIRSITYTNSSDDPTTATRTVSYTVNDGDVDSNTQTRDITLAASNDASVITAIEVGDLAYAENDGAVAITSSVTVSDSDDTNLESAVVQITGNYVDGEDILSFTTQNGITGVFNSVSGAMTLTGTATVAEYQAAIRSITYTNSSDDPTTATRTVSYTVNDGDVDSNTQTRDITLAASNDAAVIAAIEVGDLAYAENDGAVAITSTVTVSDSDDTSLESAVVQITGNYVDGEDILSFTTQNGITGVFNSVSGAMTLTGTATVAEYQAAIRSITYTNSSDDPSTATRTVSYTVNDGDVDSNTQTRDIVITAVNDAPVAVNDTLLDGVEDSTSAILNTDILSNDSDLEGDSLSITAINGFALVGGVQSIAVTNGTVNVDASDNITFSADSNYNGAVSFVYTISDGSLTDTATVSGTITAANDAPVAVNDTLLDGVEDSTSAILNTDILSNDSDLDGDTLSITAINGTALVGGVQSISVTNGTVNIDASDNITFSADSNYNGAVSFDYTISDGSLTDTATVSGTITPVNDAPDAVNDTLLDGVEDSTSAILNTDILSNDSDLDGDAISITAINGTALVGGVQSISVTNGTVNIDASDNITFSADTNYNGAVSFDYTISDGLLTDTATVSGTISTANDAPVAVNDTLLDGVEDSTSAILNTDILSNDSDLDGDSLSITAINGTALVGGVQSIAVTNGTVNIDASDNITFSADPNYNGAVSFDYTISDGSLTDTATVSGTITPVNDAPDAVNDTLLDGVEDSTSAILNTDILSNDSDLDGDTISITAINGTALVGGVQSIAVTNGTVNVDASDNITFSADTNYNGAVSFDYTISDGLLTDTATVSGTISTANDAPVAVNDTLLDGVEDSTSAILNTDILSNDSDLDGDTLSITAINGTALVGGVQSIAVTNGTVNIDASDNITFSADSNYNGAVSFLYTLSDGSLTDTATVSGTITPVNDAPVAVNDTLLDGVEDSTSAILNTDILSNDSDLDGDAISITAINGTALVGGVQSISVTNGTVNIDASDNITFSADTNYNGAVSFDYTISDGLLTDTATVSGTISTANDAPVAVNDTLLDGVEDSTSAILNTDILSNDSDLDGDSLSITAINGTALVGGVQSIAVTNGTVNIDASDNITFSADTNYNGAVSFLYTISDGSLTDTATVSGTITPVNDAPDAVNDTLLDEVEDSTSAILNTDILSNDSDLDGDTISITAINGTALVGGVQSIAVTNGTVNVDASDNITFSADTNYNGAVSFDYTISDGLLTDTATVSGTISTANDAPVAVNDTLLDGVEDSTSAILNTDILSNDSDLDGDSLSITAINGTALVGGVQSIAVTNGTVNIDASDNITFSADTNYNGAVSFLYTISDGSLTDTATVSGTITPVNDAPDAVNDTLLDGVEDSTSAILNTDILSNDSDLDGDTISITAINGTALVGGVQSIAVTNGTVNVDASDNITFSADTNYNGAVSFDYTISDGLLTDTATVSGTISTANDAPVAVNDTLLDGVEDSTSTILNTDILSNDSDLDGDSLSITAINGTALVGGVQSIAVTNGTVNVDASDNITFSADPNYNGAVSFDYTISDGSLTDTATVSGTITPVNDAPDAVDDTLLDGVEDSTSAILNTDILSNDSDLDGDTLSITAINGTALVGGVQSISVTNGTVNIDASDNITFSADTNYNGAVSFDYTISDGLLTDTATVSGTISTANDAPVAVNDTLLDGLEDSTSAILNTDILSNDSDLDGDSLSITAINGTALVGGVQSISVTNGTVNIDASDNITFSVDPNYNGAVSFLYTLSDGSLTDTATVSGTITPVNDAPVAVNDTLLDGVEDSTSAILNTDILSNDSDLDGDTISITAINGTALVGGVQSIAVTNGTVNIDASDNITFSADTNYNGAVSFDYTISDGLLTDTATVSGTISTANDAPVAVNDTLLDGVEDSTSTILNTDILSNDSDLDGDSLSITAINGTALVGGVQSISVTNGTVNIDASDNITFSADPNYNGAVSFLYTLSDGSLTDTATVSGTITPVNDAPDAVDDTLLDGVEDTTSAILNTDILSNDSDLDGDSLSITAINGTALVGGVQSIAVTNGTVNVDASDNITFSADTNYNGAVSFDYTISDGLLTDTATVSGTISTANDAPVAVNDTLLDGVEDSTSTILNTDILSNDSDLDGDSLSITAINGTALVGGVQSIAVTNGTVNVDASDNITFSADPNYNGAVSFLYTLSDGSLTDTATVSGTITPVNDAPDAVNDTLLDGVEDSTSAILNTDILSNDSDLDGDTMSITAINGTALVGGVQSIAVTNGTVNVDASDNITFSADTNYNGAVSFDYTISDGLLTDTATVSGTISTANDAPVAVNDTLLDGLEDSTSAILNTDILSNDSDLDGDSLSITAINGTALVGGVQSIAVTNGTVNIDASDNITFSADTNYNGAVSFLYTLSDGSLTDTATVSGTITPVNDAPDAVNDTLLDGLEDSTSAILNNDILSNDSDLDGDTISITAINGTALVGGVQSIAVTNGTVNVDASDNITFSADTNYNGAVSFDYTISDGLLTDTATVSGTISTANDAPVEASIEDSDLAYTENDGAVAITNTLLLSDIDDTNLASAIIQITGNYVNGEDLLSFTNQNGISGLYNAVSGTMSLTGTATVADYQAAIRSITYTNTSEDPSTNTRTVSFTVNDGDLDSNTETRDITIIAVNDAAVIDLDANDSTAVGIDYTTTWTQGNGSILITDTDAVLSDVDDTDITSLTVSITNHWDGVNEILSADTADTDITATYDNTTGVLTLSGSATLADYQQVLKTIRYDNTHSTPAGQDRTIEFVANDGTANSIIATTTFTMSTDVSVLVVTNTSDTIGGDTSSIAALFANDGGDGISLREAIVAANNSANGDGAHVIRFDFAGAGPHIVNLTSALPVIDETIVIDGSSEPDFMGTPMIILDGNGISDAALTLGPGASGSNIHGLIIRDAEFGIWVQNGSNNNTIAGNWIGQFNADGSDAGIDNVIAQDAILVEGNNNIIGGTTDEDRNVIIGGVYFYESGAANNTVSGNYFGTDTTGNALLASGSGTNGVFATNGANNNTIGGATDSHRNVFGGLDYAIDISGLTTDAFVIQNNWIGLGADGTTVLANGQGISLYSGDNHIIGGVGTGNVILGSTGTGIWLSQGDDNLTIQGNYIGTNESGSVIAGNDIGIRLEFNSINNLIGGINAGEGNIITASTNAAIMTDTGLGTVGNSILGNTLFGNNGLSIDLNNDGVTANDTDDADMGSNNLQNYPLLISAISNGVNSVNLNGSINTNANTTYRIEFFASATGDGSGNPEAERYLGFATVTSDGSGNATFSETLSVLVSDGEVITATATVDLSGGNYGDTSEFAANIVAEVNEAPVNTLPSAQTVNEDTRLNITGISVTDVDGNLAFTQLSVTNGVLNVSLLGGATISSGTNDSNTLTLSGSQVQINAALATLSYQGNLDFNGIDTLTVLSTDSGSTPLSDSDNVAIRVDAVSDAAVITGVDIGALTEDVDVFANIISSSGLLTINDVDTGESSFQAETVNGSYGDLSIDTAGNWRYEANNTQLAIQQLDVSESLTDIFIVTAFDGTTHNVVITLNGSEDAAEIGGTTTGSVTQDATLTSSGNLTITDTDTSDNPVKFDDVTSTLGTAGYGRFELINNTWTYTLDNNNSAVVSMISGQTFNDSIRFKANDGSTQLVIVTIYGSGNPADTSPEEPIEEEPIEEEPIEEEATEEKPNKKESDTENNTPSIKSELSAVESTVKNEISTQLSSFREVQTNTSQTDNRSELINSNFTLSEDEVPKDINPKKYNVQMPDDISLNLDELDLWVDTETEVDEEGKNALWAEFDKTLQNMKDEMAINIPKDIEVNIVTGSAATFSVGILAWALQGGSVLASLMSTAPILSRFDPIPILQSKGKSIDIQGDLDKSKKDKPSRQVDDLFSQGNSK